jgi:hypothetical protein
MNQALYAHMNNKRKRKKKKTKTSPSLGAGGLTPRILAAQEAENRSWFKASLGK